MQFSAVQRILGILLMLFSLTMIPPVIVSIWYGDGAVSAFLIAFVIILMVGGISWVMVRDQ